MIKPLRSNVLIRPSDAPRENKIGIIIQAAVRNEGTVVAVGSEVKELKVGDMIRYDSGVTIDADSVGYVMCREADVFCVVE